MCVFYEILFPGSDFGLFPSAAVSRSLSTPLPRYFASATP
jgi:hypothetical protein